MASKKGKVPVENAWRAAIEDAQLNDNTFQVKVVVIEAAGSDQDRIYLNKFETFAAEEKRFVIKNICKSETIFMVSQLGGEKKVKDDNLRIFEEGQAYIKEKKAIPVDILALIIKHLILNIKDEYIFIKKQKLQVKEGMHRESMTMVENSEVKSSVQVAAPIQEEPVSLAKGKKKDIVPATEVFEPEEGKKYNTLLRVRGEEWRDKVYVDDFPTDGPNIYLALTGFTEPLLPSCLIQIGIPISAIIQVRIDPVAVQVPSSLFRATKRGQSQTDMLAEITLKYWEDLQLQRIKKESAEYFNNTAFIVFSPPYWDSQNLSGDPATIYDELCYLMYDVQDLTRQHAHYLDNLDIVHVPEEIRNTKTEIRYSQHIADIPLECLTFYTVLDSILRTVCDESELDDVSTTASTNPIIKKPRMSVGNAEKVEKAENFVREVFNTLCKTDTNKKAYRLTYGEEYEDHKDPIVIKYGDFVKNTTFHLGNINLDNIVFRSLFNMPLHQLWANQEQPSAEDQAKINFHINILLSSFQREDLETSEFNRLMHILSCRKLFNNRSSLKKTHLGSSSILAFKKTYLKRSTLAEPLSKPDFQQSCSSLATFPSMIKSENLSQSSYTDDSESSRIKLLFDCPDISELVSAAEIANGKPMANSIIDSFEHFEDFSGVRAFQILLDVFSKFSCVDYKYCEVTDCFLLMFFNSHDKDNIAREEWRSHLATPLCLQDFFDYVLEEHYDWIQNEEKIYDETIVTKDQSVIKVSVNPDMNLSCIGDVEVEMELLMEGSIKYQKNVEEKEEEDVETLNPKKYSTTDSIADSAKKSSSKTSKSHQQSKVFTSRTYSSSSSTVKMPKMFYGYDLGERRVEVFGRDSLYFSKDGTIVHTEYTLCIPNNTEYVKVSVKPGNKCNGFWFHKALSNGDTSDVDRPVSMDSCDSFRIMSKDDVMINIKQQTYQSPPPLVLTSTLEGLDSLQPNTYHSLFVTWPNGLITESVHENNSPAISHIKQYYLCPKILNEDKRCISLNGEVIIFRPSEEIEVLRPDGSRINITKCSKNLKGILSDVFEDVSESSSDKSKKGKGKLEKDNKSKPKKSKKSIDDHVNKEEEEAPPPEYEYVMEEFEIIETSGLRQKWTHNIPFTIEKLLIRTATDYCLGEVFSRRMDGTHILLNKDGIHVTTFPDKTRIITTCFEEDEEVLPEWTIEEEAYFEKLENEILYQSKKIRFPDKDDISSEASFYNLNTEENLLEEERQHNKGLDEGYVSVQIVYTIEHPHFTTISINKANGDITVESPNDTTVVLNSSNSYKFFLDNVTTATFIDNNLNIFYEACPECQAYTTCDIKTTFTEEINTPKDTRLEQYWLKLKDSFTKSIIVDKEGSIHLVEDIDETSHPYDIKIDQSVETIEDGKSESSMISHVKCREMYLAKALRFFVLRRDLTCSELVHHSLLDSYKRKCRWLPWCSINEYDTFGDQRSLLSMVRPLQTTEPEKWLMSSKLANKPKNLTYKDLQKDCGKGFYHWMRPYGRFTPKAWAPDDVLPQRLPKAFVLRTLEKQWKDADRNKYKGAKELIQAILKYRQVIEFESENLLNIPVKDPRTDDERKMDEAVQALGHRMYETLKMCLDEDVGKRAMADITTAKLPPVEEELSVTDEHVEEEFDAEESERCSLLKQAEDAEELSSTLKRYWRRREEEYKEELFYQQLLRDGSVPPYFKNILGGAIWWEMNNIADNAIARSERMKTRCICPCEESSSDNNLMPHTEQERSDERKGTEEASSTALQVMSP